MNEDGDFVKRGFVISGFHCTFISYHIEEKTKRLLVAKSSVPIYCMLTSTNAVNFAN